MAGFILLLEFIASLLASFSSSCATQI